MSQSLSGERTLASANVPVRLGLRENWKQFPLLVLANAFAGGMVGLERTVVPLVVTEGGPAAVCSRRGLMGRAVPGPMVPCATACSTIPATMCVGPAVAS